MDREVIALIWRTQEAGPSSPGDLWLGVGTLLITALGVLGLMWGVRSNPAAARSRATWLLIVSFACIGIGVSGYVGIGIGPASPLLDVLAKTTAVLFLVGLGILVVGLLLFLAETIVQATRGRDTRRRG